jgi:CDP-glucose 4,6-dehydratase
VVDRSGAVESLGLTDLFGGVYRGKRVLVTGHTGFKGSWLCLWLRALGAEVSGLSLPPTTTPSHWALLGLDDVRESIVDIRDAAATASAIERAQPDVVFHLAAQALVRPSYAQPSVTFETNVMGLVNVLDALRACGSARAIVNATTDKVYSEDAASQGYSEDDPLGGHDPYSTSKACAELVTDCYRKSFFGISGTPRTAIASARAGNVIGGGDWSQDRLVPDLIRAAVAGTALRIRNPTAIRPWQHVLDPLSGYLRLGQALLEGHDAASPWNFGPDAASTVSVMSLVEVLEANWPGATHEVESSPGVHEAAILRLDVGKARGGLDWRPVWGSGETVSRTARWYRDYYERNQVTSTADLEAYVDSARRMHLAWAR